MPLTTLTATVTTAAVITGSIPHPSLSRTGFPPAFTHLAHHNSASSPTSCDISLLTSPPTTQRRLGQTGSTSPFLTHRTAGTSATGSVRGQRPPRPRRRHRPRPRHRRPRPDSALEFRSRRRARQEATPNGSSSPAPSTATNTITTPVAGTARQPFQAGHRSGLRKRFLSLPPWPDRPSGCRVAPGISVFLEVTRCPRCGNSSVHSWPRGSENPTAWPVELGCRAYRATSKRDR